MRRKSGICTAAAKPVEMHGIRREIVGYAAVADLLDQLQQVRKMGSIKDLLKMIPGVGKKIDDVEVDERQFDRVQALILSMTPQEREKPDIINPSRKRRIAAGSGTSVQEVNQLFRTEVVE